MFNMNRMAPGHYQLRLQDGVVDVRKVAVPIKARSWHVSLDGSLVATFGTRDAALTWASKALTSPPSL
jgi:hypothetical protein